MSQGPELAILSCLKNEAEDLVEWLCWHRHLGVDRFFLYDNESTDRTREIIESMPFADRIELRSVDTRGRQQKRALRHGIKRYGRKRRWALLIDGDEYLMPLDGEPVKDKLRRLEAEGVDGIGIHWRVFGSSGHETRPDGLLTESFTRRAPDGLHTNHHVKSLVRLDKAIDLPTVHYVTVEGRYILDTGVDVDERFKGIARTVSYDHGLAIHHYIVKSRDQCLRKIARGRPHFDKPFRPPSYFDEHDHNEVEDRGAIAVIAPIRDEVLALRERLGRE